MQSIPIFPMIVLLAMLLIEIGIMIHIWWEQWRETRRLLESQENTNEEKAPDGDDEV